MKKRVFDSLRENWVETAASLAGRLSIGEDQVKGALSAYAQAGRAIYDLNKDVYRVRELSREPLPFDALRFANQRESAADALLRGGKARVRESRTETGLHLTATITESGGKKFKPETLDRFRPAPHQGRVHLQFLPAETSSSKAPASTSSPPA